MLEEPQHSKASSAVQDKSHRRTQGMGKQHTLAESPKSERGGWKGSSWHAPACRSPPCRNGDSNRLPAEPCGQGMLCAGSPRRALPGAGGKGELELGAGTLGWSWKCLEPELSASCIHPTPRGHTNREPTTRLPSQKHRDEAESNPGGKERGEGRQRGNRGKMGTLRSRGVTVPAA